MLYGAYSTKVVVAVERPAPEVPSGRAVMFKVVIEPRWQLQAHDGEPVVQQLIGLLVGIHETGSLAGACARAELSYRYAWGVLRRGQQLLGAPLVESARGSGARLTTLGEKLVWADKRISARLSPLLDSLASEIEVEFERAVDHAEAILRIHASHGFAVETLHRVLTERGIAADLKYRSSREVLASLGRGNCDLAGLHVPIGEFEAKFLRLYAKPLRAGAYKLIDLATRRQGLMIAPGNPKKIRGIADLARRGVRYVNRQSDSGTRELFDLLLAKHRIDGRAIDGYDTGEYTHAAVAAYVASGMADAGLGIETPAQRFGLDFIPLVKERYFFLAHADFAASAASVQVTEILRSAAFRKVVDALPGYDATHCGRMLEIAAAFPALR
ncbi:MAG TPA: substrate-binding domain-containing protein [Rudaea sp.]|nr:substrate-binding domain-containing protein [Rudaea sp.]